MNQFRPFALAAVLLAAVLLVGCSDPHKGRSAVSGKVTLKDQPLKNGIVIFEPLDNQDTGATSVLANGAYSIPQANGLKAGRYLVRVTAGDGKTVDRAEEPGADGPGPGGPGPGGGTNIVSKDLVPPEWNRLSKQEVTVVADKPNVFDFNIK